LDNILFTLQKTIISAIFDLSPSNQLCDLPNFCSRFDSTLPNPPDELPHENRNGTSVDGVGTYTAPSPTMPPGHDSRKQPDLS
jgi:hypothetical protein